MAIVKFDEYFGAMGGGKDQFGREKSSSLDSGQSDGGGRGGKSGMSKIGSSPGDIKDKAEQIRAATTKQLKQIQDNRDWKPEAKTRMSEELKKKSNGDLVELRHRFKKAVDAENADLHRSFILPKYGSRGDTVGIRDAITKAAAIQTEAEARKMLSRARTINDVTLERAIVYEARAKVWRGLVNDWSEADPEGAADLQALNESDDKINSPGQKLGDALSFTLIS